MKELRDIIQAYHADPEKTLVLATVVAARGATYRKPGARMLMSEHAWLAGAISGGCVEADLLRTAWWRTSEHATLVTYDASASDQGFACETSDASGESESSGWGFGLDCDGSIDVLLERVAPDVEMHPLRLLARALHGRKAAVLSTVIGVMGTNEQELPIRVGQHVLALEGETPTSDLPFAVQTEIVAHALRILGSARGSRLGSRMGATSYSRHIEGDIQIEVAHELVLPARSLVIFGRNYDAIPLARVADELGWDVTLVAQEAPFTPQNVRIFNSARLVLGHTPDILASLPLDPRASLVVMTHDYQSDKNILRHVLHLPVAYVGVLGPEQRTQRMLSELAREGLQIDDGALRRLHAPVGLDVGASAPEEIALSIVAELQAASTARSGRPLREAMRLETRHASKSRERARADS